MVNSPLGFRDPFATLIAPALFAALANGIGVGRASVVKQDSYMFFRAIRAAQTLIMFWLISSSVLTTSLLHLLFGVFRLCV